MFPGHCNEQFNCSSCVFVVVGSVSCAFCRDREGEFDEEEGESGKQHCDTFALTCTVDCFWFAVRHAQMTAVDCHRLGDRCFSECRFSDTAAHAEKIDTI